MIDYFAYGSNLHPLRLRERVPSAELVGVAALPGHRLVFHKKSDDGSSKCNLVNTNVETDLIHGAIYQIDPGDKPRLDRYEGKGYREEQVSLTIQGDEYVCFAYVAQPSHIVSGLPPYHWYKALVMLGAEYLAFPAPYLAALDAVESMEDPDPQRGQAMERLIEAILNSRNS